jgi:hypothetical protein
MQKVRERQSSRHVTLAWQASRVIRKERCREEDRDILPIEKCQIDIGALHD